MRAIAAVWLLHLIPAAGSAGASRDAALDRAARALSAANLPSGQTVRKPRGRSGHKILATGYPVPRPRAKGPSPWLSPNRTGSLTVPPLGGLIGAASASMQATVHLEATANVREGMANLMLAIRLHPHTL